MRAVVVAHGDVLAEDRAQVEGADLVVAANGGALALERWGVTPNVVIGDLDSLGAERAEELAARGVRLIRHPSDKDESDLELAVDHAIAAGAHEVTLLGIFGGPRLDYVLANATLLADPRYRGRGLRAAHGPARMRALHGGEATVLAGVAGDLVTLVPLLGDAEGVRTQGLRYALSGATLRFGRSRGVSNVITSAPASVSLERGTLLVIETRTTSAR